MGGLHTHLTRQSQHGPHLAIASALLALASVAHPLAAQPRRLPPPVIGQVVDEVLRAIVPPDSALSRVPVRERGVYFDYGRTLAAFGYRDDSITRVALSLKSVVVPGTDALLDDCNQGGTKPCDRLGQGAYVYVTPLSRSTTEMIVRLHVLWPDRGGAAYVRGVTPGGRVFLYGFAIEVHLARAPDGSWRFSRPGRARVSETPFRAGRRRGGGTIS